MKPILLATDGSPSANAATREAIELACAFGAPLTIVSVAQTHLPAYGTYYGYTEIAADLRKTEAEHVAQTLAATAERARAAGVDCETVALDGVPGHEICRFARGRKPRLIVVGAHGWGRFGRLLHGSVSTHVLHHAPCPVLVVVGEDADQTEGITAMNGAANAPVAGGSTRS